MIKFVIFDFDGVIEDNYELHYKFSKQRFKDITREEHKKLFDGNVYEGLKKLTHMDMGFDFKTHFTNARKSMKVKDEVKDMLKKLFQGYKLGIITSAGEQGINDYLESNDLLEFFSFVYGYETDKIKVHKFEKVLDEYKVKKEECIFVTDTLGDILEANKVGIKTIAVDFGFHEKERLQKGKPIKIISHIDELIPSISLLCQ